MMNSILMAVLVAVSSGQDKNKPEAEESGKIYICEATTSGPDKDVQLKNCKQVSQEPTPTPTPTPTPSPKPRKLRPSYH